MSLGDTVYLLSQYLYLILIPLISYNVIFNTLKFLENKRNTASFLNPRKFFLASTYRDNKIET